MNNPSDYPWFSPPIVPPSLPTFELSAHPIGISTTDLNAFLSNFQICGSTLVSAQIPAAISTGRYFRSCKYYEQSSNVTVFQQSSIFCSIEISTIIMKYRSVTKSFGKGSLEIIFNNIKYLIQAPGTFLLNTYLKEIL